VVSARERFCTVLAQGPLLLPDALVVLCGEDAEARLDVATELYRYAAVQVMEKQRGVLPRVVLSGGRHDPPRHVGAATLHGALMGRGVAHNQIVLEAASTNTREQAVNVVEIAAKRDWRRLLLVASAYHMPRAFLTFVCAIREAGLAQTVELTAAPVTSSPWFGAPAGMDTPRIALLEEEFAKIDAYREHVATYEEGLAYLQSWEGR
jgi:uncharacterized SAM-binding protein YcdF (DUF218 family)